VDAEVVGDGVHV
jgi:hypothetical protein